jgi:hypothetical protein
MKQPYVPTRYRWDGAALTSCRYTLTKFLLATYLPRYKAFLKEELEELSPVKEPVLQSRSTSGSVNWLLSITPHNQHTSADANTIRLGPWNGLMYQRDTAEMLYANLERKNCMVAPPSNLSRIKQQQHPRAANILSSGSRLTTDLSFNHTQWATSSAQYPRKIKHARHSRDVEERLSTRTPNN